MVYCHMHLYKIFFITIAIFSFFLSKKCESDLAAKRKKRVNNLVKLKISTTRMLRWLCCLLATGLTYKFLAVFLLLLPCGGALVPCK